MKSKEHYLKKIKSITISHKDNKIVIDKKKYFTHLEDDDVNMAIFMLMQQGIKLEMI